MLLQGKIEKVGTYGELSEEELKQLQQDEEVEEKRQSVVKAERLLSVTSQAVRSYFVRHTLKLKMDYLSHSHFNILKAIVPYKQIS